MKPMTLFDKIWDYHLINTQEDGASLIYIDRHLVHEVTSPQAFEGLRLSGRVVNSPRELLQSQITMYLQLIELEV